MARSPCGPTAVVAANATAAVSFGADRIGVGCGEINDAGAIPAMLSAILPQQLASLRWALPGRLQWFAEA